MFSDPVRRQRGVTLVELIIFIVIVGIALVGILQVLSLTTRNSADPLRRKQALMIAEGLLEEVQLAKFTYCDPADANAQTAGGTADCAIATTQEQWGPESLNVRPFDNVNDYVGAANTPTQAFDVAGKLADANGNPLELDGYSARVTVAPAALGPAAAPIGAPGTTSADTTVLRITVEVRYDNNQSVVLDAYRTRYAPNAI